MAYETREKYIVPAKYQQEVFDMLMARRYESGIHSKKIRDLMIYMKPLTKSRWSKYLTFKEMVKYLVQAEDSDYEKETLDNTPTVSVVDELLKLKQLLDINLITREEFESQKAKILGK